MMTGVLGQLLQTPNEMLVNILDFAMDPESIIAAAMMYYYGCTLACFAMHKVVVLW